MRDGITTGIENLSFGAAHRSTVGIEHGGYAKLDIERSLNYFVQGHCRTVKCQVNTAVAELIPLVYRCGELVYRNLNKGSKLLY